jgi:hypothetical protein
MPPFSKSRETAQNAAQAIRDIESLSQQLTALQEDLNHTRLLLEGLWELYKEQTGKTDADLEKTVSSIEERLANSPREAEKCSSCGRAIQERTKACIYCGTMITTRRLF